MQTTVTPFFTPTQISGCQLWLDGADRNSLVLSGSNVRQWNDKSGGGRNFIQQGSFALPVFVNNGISSQSAVSFTGNNIQNDSANQILTNASYILNSSASGYSIFLVARQNASHPTYTSYNYAISAYGAGAGSGLFYGTDPNGYLLTANGTAGPTYGFNDLNANTPNTLFTSTLLTSIDVNGSVLTPYLNGTAMGTKTGTCVAVTGINIGNAYAPGQTFTGQTFGGVIGEILIYNGVITRSQRQQIEGYLAWKWGLQSSLPANHPYKTSIIPPLLNPPTTLAAVVNNSNTTFIPTQIPGCQLWFDADDTASLTIVGGFVTRWDDKSGNNWNLTANGNLPRITFNNRQAIQFTNSPFLQNTSFTNTGPYAIFYMMKFNSIVQGGDWQTLTDNVSPLRPYVGLEGSTGLRTSMHYGGAATLNAEIWSLQYSTTDVTVFNVNGANSYGASTGYGGVGHTNGIRVGFAGNSTAPLNGWIGEILYFGGTFTTSQRQQVEGYLAWKWGVQANLPTSHPYKLGPSFIPSVGYPALPVAKAAAWNPLQISGCSLWLDAADRASLTVSGSNVTQWNDKSGNGRNATGYNTTATFNPNGLNPGYSALEFSATKSMQSPVPLGTFSSAVSGFIIYKFIGSVNLTAAYGLFSRTVSPSNGVPTPFDMYSFSNSTYRSLGNGTVFTQSSVSPNYITQTTASQYNFSIQSSATTTWNESVNGTFVTLTTSGGTGAGYGDTGSNVMIGGRLDTAVFFQGVISEVILYNISVTTSQRQQVEGYLAWKWGLQANLPANHPWKRWPPPP